MVGEDTVKTNSRFYFTRTPDSVPSFLDALLDDAMQQTREANLYAPTGTRNYWPAEAIAYAQGSDHDVFLGLGIPATMLGHDPDWTHHTSEDKIDKTDASEFRRVGVLASAAAYWAACFDEGSHSHTVSEELRRIIAASNAEGISELVHRIAADDRSTAPGKRRIERNMQSLRFLLALTNIASTPDASRASNTQPLTGSPSPRRLVVLPFDAAVFESVSQEDHKWLAEQEARFASDSEGLATKPSFALISFEAVNFMNGRSNTSEIADLLSAEFLLDIDQAWVDRLVGILEKQKLVAK
jgi:hypothetical protein